MKRNDEFNDERIEEIARQTSKDSLSPEQISASADHVWALLDAEISKGEVGALRSCDDHQALIPALLDGSLNPAQALLVEDHTRECIPCRRALMKARAGETAVKQTPRRSHRFPLTRYAGVAAAFFAVLIVGVTAWQYMPVAGSLTVESVQGQFYSVSHPEKGPLAAGAEIPGGEVIRTGRNAAAFLKLSDGSILELSPRSEISVDSRRSGTTINLERGHVIVEAAKQRQGKLYVATDDCLVSVTGTVFSVKSGTKGSRVSVIEGEVLVDHSGEEDILHPGDQISTHVSLGAVSIEEEIAWSQQVEKHLALLEELVALHRELREKTFTPDLRHESELLELVARDTTVYFAMPNVTQTLVDTHRIFNERIGQSPVLNAWWQEVALPSGLDAELSRAVATIGDFGQTLGPEIVITVTGIDEGLGHAPKLLMLATLEDAATFRSLLDNHLEGLEELTDHDLPLQLIDDPFAGSPGKAEEHQFFLWIDGDLLAGAPSLEQLRSLAARRQGNEPGFRGTGFYDDLKSSYDDGAAWLVGADLESIINVAIKHPGLASPEMQREVLQLAVLGVTDLQRLVAEHKSSSGDTVDRATVTFSQPRRGIAGLLAEPAPMGSMEFVSPEATAMLALALKEPSVLAEE